MKKPLTGAGVRYSQHTSKVKPDGDRFTAIQSVGGHRYDVVDRRGSLADDVVVRCDQDTAKRLARALQFCEDQGHDPTQAGA